MSAADITTWESLVGFCSGFFDLLNNTFNSSLLGEFLKARVFMGYSYSYGSLLCTFLVTGIVWIPVVCFVWQLYRYPAAFFCTIGGFILTYVVMSVLGYKITKKEVDEINAKLAEESWD